jgi:phage protein D
MLKPAYKLTIGGKVVDTTDEPKASTVVDLAVYLDLDTPADAAQLTLGNVGFLKPKQDDDAIIELGYADNGGFTQVMAGKVTAVDAGLTTTRILIHSASNLLLRTFVDQTYENKTAGAIVHELADAASVDVASASDGIQFPAYVVDGRRAVCHHIRDLADLCGLDSYINPGGKLVFEEFSGGKTVHVLEYAKHIFKLDVLQNSAPDAEVVAFGESPGASRGDQSWAWLTKNFGTFKGSSGSGAPTALLERPALRTAQAAQIAANAALRAVERQTVKGTVMIAGAPKVALGDAVRLSGVPNGALNNTYQVRSVTHRITKMRGFTTAVGFMGIPQ